MEESLVAEVDQIQVNISECFVYQIPALRTSQGHRAEDWKLENPLFTGGLRVYQRGDSLRIIIYRQLPLSLQPIDDSPYSIFAECPIKITNAEMDMVRFVDGVIDSSRYFVLRVQDPRSDRSTFIGVGFRERDTAFEFKNCLNDYIRYISRIARAKEMHDSVERTASAESGEQSAPSPASTKHALKEGEKLKLKIGSQSEREGRDKSKNASSPGVKPLLKPSTKASANDDDDWGDFVAST